MRDKCIKILFFLIFIFVYKSVKAQNINDELKYENDFSLIKKGLFEEALLLNIGNVEKAKINNDKKSITLGYIRIASILCGFGEHLESLRYLDLADKLADRGGFRGLKIRVLGNYGRNYSALNINKSAIEYFNRSIKLCLEAKPVNQNILSFLYINKADAFLDTEYESDSTLVYIHKAIKIKENPFKYAVVANYYLKEDVNIDSAKYYLSKSKSLVYFNNNIAEYYKSTVLHADANFKKAVGDYNEAIDLYKKSLNIYKKIKKTEEVKLSYRLISEAYAQLKDEKKTYEYLLKYTKITDSINTHYNQKINVVISNFLKEQENAYQEKEKKYSFFVGIVVLLSIGVVVLIIYSYRKKRQQIISEKEKIIKQKNAESTRLKEKLNIAFDEVILLAKNNDCSFLIRFQEVYPNVCARLLEINPKLVNTELSLCAMIWLNFSSKDIAIYTNIQPKTVQTKKYRLRKKLDIPENANVYTWLKNLVSSLPVH